MGLQSRGRVAAGCILAAFAHFAIAHASAQENFYAGKTIRIVVGSGAGDAYDGAARLTSRYLGKHIPGNPTVIVENMPGASGVKAANYLYQVAPRDGTVIAGINSSVPVFQAMGQPGVRYKAEELNWIGSLLQTPTAVLIWHTAGITTIEQAKKNEVVMGATAVTGAKAVYLALLNSTLGTKFKIVAGYEGGAALSLAMERGEVQGDGGASWSSLKSTKPDWIREKKIIPVVQFGLKKADDLPNVPLLIDLAQNDEQRKMFEFICQPTAMQQPFVAPPGVPPERVQELRRGFEAMIASAEFIDGAKRLDLELDPTTGENVQKIVNQIVGTPAEILQKLKVATALGENGAGGAPANRAVNTPK